MTRKGLTLLYYSALAYTAALLLLLVLINVVQSTPVGVGLAVSVGGGLLFALWYFDEPFLLTAIGFVGFGLFARSIELILPALSAVVLLLGFGLAMALPLLALGLFLVGAAFCLAVPEQASPRQWPTIFLAAAITSILLIGILQVEVFILGLTNTSLVVFMTRILALACSLAMHVSVVLMLRSIAAYFDEVQVYEYVFAYLPFTVGIHALGVIFVILASFSDLGENLSLWVGPAASIFIVLVMEVFYLVAIAQIIWFSRCLEAGRSIVPDVSTKL